MISLICCKIHCLYLLIFYLACGLIHLKCFEKQLYCFFSFKGITRAYLLPISITQNKNLNPLFNLLINCISARSVP